MVRDFRFPLSETAPHAVLVFLLVALASPAGAQQKPADTMTAGSTAPNTSQGDDTLAGSPHGKLLQVPLNVFVPGGASVRPKIKTPDLQDAAAIQRGMRAFNAFNCVGCHMGNGGGGMGPALSNSLFIYGGEPENIYLTIVQGRPNGMPAWGAVLPEDIIWDLVAYVTSISKEPKTSSWGVTVAAGSPDIEQVPAELQSTAKPWDHTQKFSNGQKP